ncbi:MAG: zinc ribbon domain-containing protein [Clostridia bacterium]|nr:zinc ribbon domain-containing protein [Clostridia bacterium]
MGVLEDFFVKAKVAVDALGEKAGQIVDVSKLNIKMAELKNDMKNEYVNLGKAVYKAKKENTDDDATINYEIAQIDNLTLQIEELKKQIAAMQNKVLCKSCGQPNEVGSHYCAKCGEDLFAGESSEPETKDDFEDFDE